MKTYFSTIPSTVACIYRVKEPLSEVEEWSTKEKEQDFVFGVFRKAIKILDDGLSFLEKKYPHFMPEK